MYIAESYNDIGVIYQKMTMLHDAFDYYNKSLASLNDNKNLYWKAIVYTNLGSLTYKEKKLANSITYYDIAYKLFNELNEIQKMAEIKYNLGIIHYCNNDNNNALKSLNPLNHVLHIAFFLNDICKKRLLLISHQSNSNIIILGDFFIYASL